MKRINLLTLFILLSVSLFSQQVSNSGFETFRADDWIGTGYRPDGWYSANVKRTVLGITATGDLVHEDANGRTGKCVRIHTEEVGAAGITEAAPAWISLGKPWAYLEGAKVKSATAGTDGGINFTHRPDTLALWIKRTYTTPEDANIVIYSWKGTSRGDSYFNKGGTCSTTQHFDEESDIRQAYDKNSCGTAVQATQISEGHWRSREQFTGWTEIKVPITYISNDIPEKMNIILSCANYPNFRSTAVNVGAQMWVDDLRLIYSSAVHEMTLGAGMPLRGFSPDNLEYVYPLGSKPLPAASDIKLKRSGRTLAASEYTITPAAAVGDTMFVTVNAEDGSSSTTYKIKFVGEVSKNPRPQSILVGGTPVAGFIPAVTQYDVTLPFGTTECPDITIVAADEGQYISSVSKPASLPGVATVTVAAPDGVTTQTYTLNLTVGAFTDATLTSISVNGNPINDFVPNKLNYVVELPTGTTDVPSVEYTTDYPDYQTIVVTTDSLNGATISVTPQGSSKASVYRITYLITESAYSYLGMITVGGTPLEGFAPDILEYTCSLPLGTEQLPAIEYTKGDDFQTVDVVLGDLNGVTRITVTAQSGKKSVYKITFRTELSSVSVLSDILLDGLSLSGFASDTKDYVVQLPVGTVTAPVITYVKADDTQTVTVNAGGLTGKTYIVVRAQDGSSTTYTITFKVSVSTNSRLSDILLDGLSLQGFNPETTEYNILLPRGTQRLPEITFVKGDPTQSVTKIEGGINATTRITVKAGSGAVTTYLLNFTVETSSDVTLQNIYINNVSLEGFAPDKADYLVMLPSGTVEMPAITFDKSDYAQTVTIVSGGVNGTTKIIVRAEDGSEGTYTIVMSVTKSENAYLKMIYIGGEPLAGFDKERFGYDYTIPADYPACPPVTVDKEPGQQVMISSPSSTGMVRIAVTPESGSANVYTVGIHYPRSAENKLMDITLDGKSIDGFDPEISDYKVGLPYNTAALPELKCIKGDETQKVFVEYGGLEGPTKVSVCAEDGSVRTYVINFTLEKSGISTLASIAVGGVTLDGFSPDRYDYSYTMPVSATEAPEITYRKGTEHQQVAMTVPAFEGTATIFVVSEDQSDTTAYTVTLKKELSALTSLKSITVEARDAEKPFTVELTDEDFIDGRHAVLWKTTDGTPYVTYTAGDLYQTVVMADAGINGIEIIVLAENGESRKYTVSFPKEGSDKSHVMELQLYNSETCEFVGLEGFDPARLDYDIMLPQDAVSVPNIFPLRTTTTTGKTVEISYRGVNDTTKVKVTSEDKLHTSTYRLYFHTEKSSVATLKDIFVDGTPLEDFHAENFGYTVKVKPGRTETPVLTWTAAECKQKVVYRAGDIFTPATLTVTAQDGITEKTYTVNFEIESDSKPNTLSFIALGNTVVDIEEGKTAYDVVLPYGTDEMPEIIVGKQSDADQSVIITYGNLNSKTYIDVMMGGEKTTYTLNVSVDKDNPIALTSLMVGSVEVNIENGVDSVYIINVAETPTKEAITTATPDVAIDIKSLTPAKAVIEAYSANHTTGFTKRYTIYFHYPADIIPNAGFTEWEETNNGAQKPKEWTAPADCAASYTSLGQTYKTGSEVQNVGDGVVKLVTTGQVSAIRGSVPGMITIGKMAVNLDRGGSTSSVSGGIVYRNTPDELRMDYKPVSNKNISSWHTLLTLYQSDKSQDIIHQGSFDDQNVWNTVYLPIDYGTLEYIDSINLTLNSVDKENAGDLTLGPFDISNSLKTAELHVRNPRFYFNNLLSDIQVNGSQIRHFAPDNHEYSFELHNDFQGIPKITVKGQVSDQQHRITSEGNKAIITSMAEDGTATTYTISFSRNISSNNFLKGIAINGVALDGFDSLKTKYTYLFDAPFTRIPDVTVQPGSPYQVVTYTATGKDKLVITVEAEDRGKKDYIIHFGTAKDSNAKLAALAVEGHDEFVFTSEEHEYTVSLRDDELLPRIHATRASQLQSIEMSVADTAVVTVTAPDNTATETYRIIFVAPKIPTSSVIARMEGLPDFAPDKFEYEHNMISGGLLKPVFETGSVVDTVYQKFTDNMITISVKGEKYNKYQIALGRDLATSSALTDLLRDGATQDGFMPELHDYIIRTKRGEHPALRAVAADKATITLDYDSEKRLFRFKSVSEDKLSEDSTFVTISPEFAEAVPAEILINGAPLAMNGNGYTADADFDPAVKEYTITMTSAEPKLRIPDMPDITVIAAGDNHAISIEQGGFGNPTMVTVTPETEEGVEQTYILNFSVQPAGNALLSDLALDYESVPGFAPEKTEYVYHAYTKGYIPEVTCRTADAFQTVEVDKTTEAITVKVKAENGTETVYRISIETHVSGNAWLANIMQDGVQLPGFAFNKTEYEITLPTGTAVTPEISAVAGSDGQTITIENGGVNGSTTIKVTAADGETTRTYSIHYTVALSTNNELENIYIGAVQLPGFYPAKRDYTVQLPVGTETNPVVYPMPGDKYQTVETEVADDGTVTVTVTPQDVAYKAVYTVRFETLLSENSGLKSLMVGGMEIDGFAADKYVYVCDLPVGTDRMPEISWIEGDRWQTVTMTAAPGLDGVASVEVVAQNTKFRSVYIVRFNQLLSDNDTLGVILVGGVPLDGFAPGVFEYNVTLPAGTTALPEITVEQGDEYQTVSTVSGGINGQYVITVVSQSGNTNRYVINFSPELSHNSHLAAIIFRTDIIDCFDPEMFDYELQVPYGMKELPLLFYTLAEPELQTAEYIFAKTVADTARIIVTAQDGVTKSEYRISFRHEKSINASLAEIRLGGEYLSTYARSFIADKDFAPDTYVYNIQLPYGTASIPEITCTGQVADYESIVVDVDPVAAVAVITVVSQDKMNINEYIIHFTFLKSDNALLKAIYLEGKFLKDFNPDETSYTVVYPIGTDTASLPAQYAVTYELMEEGQTVAVSQNVPEEIVLVVTAPDGVTVNVYTIRFEILLSDNTQLSDILINGVSIDNFSPSWNEYTYMLFPGAPLPTLEGIKAEESQIVTVSMGMVNEPSHIYVEAEDGTIGEYIVWFNTTDINPGERPSLDDVAWTPLGDGNFQASTIRDNVRVMVYLPSGLIVRNEKVGLIDPNLDIKSAHTGGTILNFDKKGQTYIYVFFYDNQVIAYGKFVW